jgi:branched-chain amino acid transport system permease protein
MVFTTEVLLQQMVSGLMLGGIIALIAVGISLIWGVMELINFAFGEYMMMSMYFSFFFWFYLGMDPLLATPINAVIFFFFGLLTYRILIRRIINSDVVIQIFCTFGLMTAIRYLAFFLWTPDFKMITSSFVKNNFEFIDVWGIKIGGGDLIAFVGSFITIGILYLVLKFTKLGKALRATAQDRNAAMAMGIDSDKMFAIAWGICTAASGIAGSLLSNFYYIHPYVGDVFLLVAFASVALAGFGSIFGVIVGAFIIGLVQVLGGTFFVAKLKLVYVYIVFIAILFVRPQGLWGK